MLRISFNKSQKSVFSFEIMVGFVVMLSDMFSRALFWGGMKDRDEDSKGNAILMIIALAVSYWFLEIK